MGRKHTYVWSRVEHIMLIITILQFLSSLPIIPPPSPYYSLKCFTKSTPLHNYTHNNTAMRRNIKRLMIVILEHERCLDIIFQYFQTELFPASIAEEFLVWNTQGLIRECFHPLVGINILWFRCCITSTRTLAFRWWILSYFSTSVQGHSPAVTSAC
jgi:hypothetical protein